MKASELDYELPAELKKAIAHGDLSAHGDDARTPFNFPTFKRAVVEVHVLRLHGDFAAIVRVIHHKIGVGVELALDAGSRRLPARAQYRRDC